MNQQADSISEYSIAIHQIYNLPIKDPTKLKEELWIHFENLLKPVYPNARVFDLQIALSDTKYLDLLEVLRQEKYALRLAEKRAEKDKKKSVEKHIERVNKAKQKVENYKASFQNAYPVKAFLTFSSIEAADYIKKVYSTCCCKSCDETNRKY